MEYVTAMSLRHLLDEKLETNSVRKVKEGPLLYYLILAHEVAFVPIVVDDQFDKVVNAQELARKHEKTGTKVYVVTHHTGGGTWYRVILGGYEDKDQAALLNEVVRKVLGNIDTQLVHFQLSSSWKGNPK